jgi:dihydroneopterin aldolase
MTAQSAGDALPQSPAASDRIELRGLRLVGTHGVLDEERARPQPFEVDLDIELDTVAAARSDALADTADYSAVLAAAAAVVGGRHRQLLESMAAEIASAILIDGRISAVTVSVRKLRPPVPFDVASAGVRITRRRL